MKRFIILTFIALVAIATPAQAADDDGLRLPCCIKGMYASGSLGASFLTDSKFKFLGAEVTESSHDPGFNISGALGYDFGNIRAEFEIAYRQARYEHFAIGAVLPGCPCVGEDDDDVSSVSFIVNGYYDFHIPDSSIVPYLGGGIGAAKVILDDNALVDDSDLVFAYQVMAGVGYEITSSITMTVGYRYFTTATPDYEIRAAPGQVIEAPLDSHEVVVGARVIF